MRRTISAAILLLCVFLGSASALITGGKDEAITVQGLPEGALPLANLKTRIAWWEGPPFGGGQYHFEYSGETADVQQAINLFAKIDSDRKRLIIRSGRPNSFWLGISDKAQPHPIDWQFVVWMPANWQHLRDAKAGLLPPGEEGDSPKTELLVHVSPRIDWNSLKIPDGLDVIDERLESNGVPADQGAALQGRVTDSAGNPISGATVALGNDADRQTSQSAADGSYRITKIPEGTHQIVVAAKGFASKDLYYHQFTKTTFRTMDASLAKAATARVRVVDQQDRPIAGAEVIVRSCVDRDGEYYRVAGPQRFTSDDNGEFVVDDVPEGKIKFSCHSPDYYYNSVLNEHDTNDAPILLKLQPTGTVQVSVVTADGQPVTSKYIVEIGPADVDPDEGAPIGSWGGSANIGADGRYTFKSIPPGDYVITGKPNPGRTADQTEPSKVRITGKDQHEIKLIAK